ncbi:uncharacterized protein CCR75_002140 [Bremia lactucae]|uniref:Uncharacterized protein n=1 Tax=Bremia lactucae TaxID=4779 RepID=A0A976FE24_BRELC|nr:hypothetical protein CCR75_002140 [Bremia lactucae]
MLAHAQSDLPAREHLILKLIHRNDQVLPHSRRMKPISSTFQRKPLVKSRLAMEAKSKHAEKKHRLPSDETVFYSNIWSLPEIVHDVSAAKISMQLVDISQVAYVLTSIDYKSGYEGATATETINIWASVDSQQNAAATKTVYKSKTQQVTGSISTPISEHSSEDESSVIAPSSILSLGPLKMDSKTLRNVLLSNDLISVKSAPVSAPVDDVDMSWSSQLLLGLHEPIRHALYVTDRFLERSRISKSPMNWKVREFFSWFKLHFVAFVQNQRDVKAYVLLPLIVVKYTDKRDIVALYQATFGLLDAIIAQEDDLVAWAASSKDSWNTCLGMLQDDIRRLNHVLINALALEEEAFKPAIEFAFSENAFQRYVMPRIIRATKPKRVMIPWIVEQSRVWGGSKVAKAYKDDLSFTARFLYDHVWLPYYETNIASAMKRLGNNKNNMADSDLDESWFGCAVM